jgi:RNAse (barnase) inhibitor barstar
MTKNVYIDAGKISDWDSFHDIFSKTFGFPDFYGRNMDAWIDCMTYLDDPGTEMTSVHIGAGDVLVLCMTAVKDFKKRCPDVYDAIVECSSFVNYRRIETDSPAILALSFYK